MTSSAAHPSFPTILIVEDHERVRAALCDLLGLTFPGSRLLEAANGESALALAASQPPDLVLMDVGLPEMNGVEATRRIKHILPGTQVVMLSIHEEQRYQEEAVAAGASAYVSKRKMSADLIPTLTALLPAFEDSVPSTGMGPAAGPTWEKP